MSTDDALYPLQPPDPKKESAQVFTTKRQARAYVRDVVRAMILNELHVYGRSAEGWFLGEVHDDATRQLIKAAALDFARRLGTPPALPPGHGPTEGSGEAPEG